MITVEFTENEALVIYDWLARFNAEERSELFQDQAEERVLFDLEAMLTGKLVAIVDPNYSKLLDIARSDIRD